MLYQNPYAQDTAQTYRPAQPQPVRTPPPPPVNTEALMTGTMGASNSLSAPQPNVEPGMLDMVAATMAAQPQQSRVQQLMQKTGNKPNYTAVDRQQQAAATPQPAYRSARSGSLQLVKPQQKNLEQALANWAALGDIGQNQNYSGKFVDFLLSEHPQLLRLPARQLQTLMRAAEKKLTPGRTGYSSPDFPGGVNDVQRVPVGQPRNTWDYPYSPGNRRLPWQEDL